MIPNLKCPSETVSTAMTRVEQAHTHVCALNIFNMSLNSPFNDSPATFNVCFNVYGTV